VSRSDFYRVSHDGFFSEQQPEHPSQHAGSLFGSVQLMRSFEHGSANSFPSPPVVQPSRGISVVPASLLPMTQESFR